VTEDKAEENQNKQNNDENNIFFKKRSVLMNKVLHAYNTGGGGTYDELMAITKALRYKKENLSEDASFKRLLKELYFIEQTNKRGLSKQYKELLTELIKEYGNPEPLDSNLVEKEMSKNQKRIKGNILVGICFALLLILIFAFLR
jgi:hypothetical protein